VLPGAVRRPRLPLVTPLFFPSSFTLVCYISQRDRLTYMMCWVSVVVLNCLMHF